MDRSFILRDLKIGLFSNTAYSWSFACDPFCRHFECHGVSKKVLGIVIPTKNHADFVLRQLDYYAVTKCPFTIYIGDSSDQPDSERITAKVDALNGHLKIVYQWFDPQIPAQGVTQKLVDMVKEKFVAYSGDDDLFVVEGLQDCCRFLDQNEDYATCNGRGVVFGLDRAGAHGQIQILGEYPLKKCELDGAADRLQQFLSHYWVLDFSVHRTPNFRSSNKCRDVEGPGFLLDASFTELLVGCDAMLKGKAKQLDRLCLFRQVGAHWSGLSKNTLLEWITQPIFPSSFLIFQDTVTKALVDRSRLPEELARKLVRNSFNNYLVQSMNLRMHSIPLWSKFKAARRKVARSRVARQVYNSLRMIMPGFRRDLRLERLLHRTSPYHRDFMPAYAAITLGLERK